MALSEVASHTNNHLVSLTMETVEERRYTSSITTDKGKNFKLRLQRLTVTDCRDGTMFQPNGMFPS